MHILSKAAQRPVAAYREARIPFADLCALIGETTPARLSGGFIVRLRKEAADRVEALILFLDMTEPDPEREPWLAAPDAYHGGGQLTWAGGDREEREAEDLDEVEMLEGRP